MNTCTACNITFRVSQDDVLFYEKFNVNLPTLCPHCRQQRRLSYRNERKLYKRTCDFTKKNIISIYSPDAPCVVYDQDVWWSDKWDPLSYGRDVDFSRPFFEQFNELARAVPRPCIVNMSSENSLYTNHSSYNKNCYMCINTGYSEDLFYCSNYVLYSKDCADCLGIQHCELCYFCTDTQKSSYSSYLYECQNCVNSAFLFDCRDCSDCFGCYNIRHKQYCIFNVQYTKDEYDRKLKEIAPRTFNDAQLFFEEFKKRLAVDAIYRGTVIDSCENSLGDRLTNNKNVYYSFYTFGSQDCAYCFDCGWMKTARDVTEPFKGELQLETHGCNLGYNLLGCSKCYENSSLSYCQYCWYSKELFGCFGLKRKEYCILNKQYSKSEYEMIVPKIISHMKKTGEWGEFFPIGSSPFAYNESVAQEYFPLSKEEVISRGWRWKEEEDGSSGVAQSYSIPQNIQDVSDSIVSEILACTACSKNFRIIAQELAFYRKAKLPIPEVCPDCRYANRMSLRTARSLWQDACTSCAAPIYSTYDPSLTKPAHVVCDACYKKALY